MAEQRFSVPSAPTKTAATKRTSQRAAASNQTSDRAACAQIGVQTSGSVVRTKWANSRCSRRRSAEGDGGTTLFRSVSSDEDGGNQANIAASGSEQSNTARSALSGAKQSNLGSRAAVLRRSEQTRFLSASDDEVGGLQSAIRAERSEAIKHGDNDARDDDLVDSVFGCLRARRQQRRHLPVDEDGR